MQFRPCIDLHQGMVKQIVGSTYSDDKASTPVTNFQADHPAEWYAQLYRKDHLPGGHIIQLGPGNEKAAKAALGAWPGGMQIGGGINSENAAGWIEAGAEAVIVTSWVFHDGIIDEARLSRLKHVVGQERLVLDLSCRKKDSNYRIVTNRWQTFSNQIISLKLLAHLSGYCKEFLIHAVDVEGKSCGIEKPLVELLGQWAIIPITYAGGIRSMDDIDAIYEMGRGRIDFTVGSALDIFGGQGLQYQELANRFPIRDKD